SDGSSLKRQDGQCGTWQIGVDDGLVIHVGEDSLHALKVKPLTRDVSCLVVLGVDSVELLGVALSPQHPLLAIAFSFAELLLCGAAGPGNDVLLVALCLVDQLLFFFPSADDLVKRVFNFVRRVHALQLDFGDDESALVGVHQPLQEVTRLALYQATPLSDGFVDGGLANDATEGHLGGGVQGAVGAVQLKEVVAGVGDAILDNHSSVHDVFVTCQHLRLDGSLLIASKTNFQATHPGDIDDVHLLHTRNAEVDPRVCSAGFFAQGADHSDFARLHLIDAGHGDKHQQNNEDDRP